MSSNDTTISVRGLSKAYTISHNTVRHTTMGEALVHKLRKPRQQQEKETFWALKDVSFDIGAGEVVGIIGRNGAGKSTLLKVISKITEPTAGRIVLQGRVGSLLEVGTGFHPELTGRENIFLNGAILGMARREIQSKLDAIVAFAEVERFLDTPVKRYSSGMYVRLAFSVAAHLNPEILVIDEVLAVGDLPFQQKCLKHMRSLTQSGMTILLVSHNMAAIQSSCERAVFLKDGRFVASGKTAEVIEIYQQSLNESQSDTGENHSQKHGGQNGSAPEFEGPVSITGFRMFGEDGTQRRHFKFGEAIRIRIELEARERIASPMINFGIKRGDGVIVCNFNNWYDNFKFDYIEGKCVLEGWLPPLRLIPDHYESHVLVWPWGGGHMQGEMATAAPYAAVNFGDFSIGGIGMSAGDGVFQMPAHKWRFERGNYAVEGTNITTSSLYDVFNETGEAERLVAPASLSH